MIIKRPDLYPWVNKLLQLSDEIESKDNLAIVDIVKGLRCMFDKFNAFAVILGDIKTGIESDMMTVNDYCNERKWWLVNSIDYFTMIEFYNNNLSEQELNIHIMKYFSDRNYSNLKRLSKTWDELDISEEIHQALNQILSSHIGGLYYVSVPGTIPILEYLMNDIHKKDSSIQKNKINKIVTDFKSELSSDKVYQNNFKYILRFYDSGPFDELDDFNRHKISHGRSMNYGNELISLKTILAIDEVIRFNYLLKSKLF